MTEDQAYDVMQPMAVAFSFNEDTFEQWLGYLKELGDYPAAVKTADLLCREATDRWVPGWGVFKQGYDRWVRRLEEEREESRLALQSGEYSKMRFPTYEQGAQIAWEAYCAECKFQNREPNKSFFDAWMGTGRAERRAKATGDRRRR